MLVSEDEKQNSLAMNIEKFKNSFQLANDT